MRYKTAVDSLSQVAPNEPEASLDQDWIDTKSKEIRNTADHLQAELQGYKNNLIKESIRVCFKSSSTQGCDYKTMLT